jgi:hypothetical protein
MSPKAGSLAQEKSNRSRPLPAEAACEVRELTSPKRVPPEAIKSVAPLPRQRSFLELIPYLRPNGSLGGSGKPDPKLLIADGKRSLLS